MAFTVQDFHDLIELLEQHPEWRADLRRLMLTEEVLSLPQIVRDLAEAQHRTELRVEELAEAQRRTELRVEELAEAQRRTELQVGELVEAQRRTELQVGELVEAQRRTELRLGQLQDDVGSLKGFALEERYHRRAPAYFSRLVRRSQVLAGNELAALLTPAVAQDLLSEASADEIAWTDLVVRGQRREDGTEVYLVVEISWGLGMSDVEWAVRRAALLAQLGVQTLPVVAGDHIDNEAAELCRAMHVWQVLDGHVIAPSER